VSSAPEGRGASPAPPVPAVCDDHDRPRDWIDRQSVLFGCLGGLPRSVQIFGRRHFERRDTAESGQATRLERSIHCGEPPSFLQLQKREFAGWGWVRAASLNDLRWARREGPGTALRGSGRHLSAISIFDGPAITIFDGVAACRRSHQTDREMASDPDTGSCLCMVRNGKRPARLAETDP
jgi:hypothetical protein